MLSNVKETITKYSLLTPGDRVVVAVSGGPDSVCLLHVLLLLSKDLDLSLHVAHLDHMFRGRESAGEALFVADLAKKLSVPATVEQFDVPALCRERGLSAQAGAREARYAFLGRVAREVNAARIATGHTASDQAETFLLRLTRGAGVSGLAGIPPIRENIIRPLIGATREEVLQHLASYRMSFVSDPSNTKPVYTRNRVRSELLPVLMRFNPRMVQTLAWEASLLRDEDSAAEACLDIQAEGILVRAGDSIAVVREGFSRLPRAYQRRMLRRAVDAAGGEASRLSSVQIEEAVAFLLSAQTGRAMELPHGLRIIREYDRFLFQEQATALTCSATLPVPGISSVPELAIEVETRILVAKGGEDEASVLEREGCLPGPDAENYVWQALFDYDKIGRKITIRNRLAGDWFCPSGMGGKRKKLQDFLVDSKVPRRMRDRVPLLAAQDDIAWVAGLRTDERFLPNRETQRLLLVRILHQA